MGNQTNPLTRNGNLHRGSGCQAEGSRMLKMDVEGAECLGGKPWCLILIMGNHPILYNKKYIHICTYIYIYINIYIYMYVCMYVWMYACMHA